MTGDGTANTAPKVEVARQQALNMEAKTSRGGNNILDCRRDFNLKEKKEIENGHKSNGMGEGVKQWRRLRPIDQICAGDGGGEIVDILMCRSELLDVVASDALFFL
ncbi:hypothetical protein GOBAR_AA06737 [Gossypium barbadense]|uniref:Uncharacterized protein n=1 Tax=Gossypium barbadense TaxID=3634 RepID=A0A2P5YE85_GOSBA|nr:hypothetical protein GOBAR_AA06737 [Gossypium barbadense]